MWKGLSLWISVSRNCPLSAGLLISFLFFLPYQEKPFECFAVCEVYEVLIWQRKSHEKSSRYIYSSLFLTVFLPNNFSFTLRRTETHVLPTKNVKILSLYCIMGLYNRWNNPLCNTALQFSALYLNVLIDFLFSITAVHVCQFSMNELGVIFYCLSFTLRPVRWMPLINRWKFYWWHGEVCRRIIITCRIIRLSFMVICITVM